MRTGKLLEAKLYGRKFIKEINSRAVSLVIYSGSFFKRTREELQQMDQRTKNYWWCIKPYISENALRGYMCLEMKDENSAAVKIALIYRYDNPKTTEERTKKD